MHALWLFRSCDTAWDEEERLRGSTDLPATEASVESLRMVVARMTEGPEILFHPPDDAASEAARVVATRFACRVRAVADLADPDLGLLEGLNIGQFEQRFESRFAEWKASPLTVEPPEGEPLSDARSRILGAVAAGLDDHPRARVGFVLHATALAMVRDALARGDGSSLWDRIEVRAAYWRYALPVDAPSQLAE